jgi:hypothetical protein
MSGEACSMLARLRRLPVRLRIAHLAALLRVERAAKARSCPDILLYPRPAHRSPSPALTMIHSSHKGEGSSTSDGGLRDGRLG